MNTIVPQWEWLRHVWNEARVEACPAYRALFVPRGYVCQVIIHNAIGRTRQRLPHA